MSPSPKPTSCITHLASSPLCALSLSSSELFHSNFWAWLFRYDKRFINIFFPKLKKLENITDIKREQDHRDITIWMNDGKAYVIENKLKTVAEEQQLRKYQEKLGNKFGGGVITGIDGHHIGDWRFVSYKKIGEQIEIINTEIGKNNSFNHQLIAEYASFIKQLSQTITDEFKQADKRLIISDDQCSSDLVEMGYSDLIKKLSAAHLANHLKKALGTTNNNLKIDHSFSNKKPIIGLYYDFKVGNDNYRIGIQIEGKQYRHYFEKFSTININKLYENAVQSGWLCDKIGKKWNGRNTGMRNQFCKYEDKNNRSKFVYQYWTLQNNELSFKNITELIQKDLPQALKCKKTVIQTLTHNM